MIILTTSAGAAALLLVWAGIDHVREPSVLAGHAATRLVATSLGAVEIATGAAALVALAVRIPGGRWVLAAQAGLYLAFLGYLAVRYRRNDRGDCGCARIGGRIGGASLVRAGTLGAVGIATAVGYPAVALPGLDPSDPRLPLAMAASVVLCLLLHALPPAVDGLSNRTGTRRYA